MKREEKKKQRRNIKFIYTFFRRPTHLQVLFERPTQGVATVMMENHNTI